MTKKDYVKLAKVLKTCRPSNGFYKDWENIVMDIAGALQIDNPNFNFKKFYQACGLE